MMKTIKHHLKNNTVEFWVFMTNFVMSLAALCGFIFLVANSDSETQIREIIRTEAEASRNGNTAHVNSLFVKDKDNPIIYDATPGGLNWEGLNAINRRYANLPKFKRLVHMEVKIYPGDFGGRLAEAESLTQGEVDGPPFKILGRDFWEFRKVNQIPFIPWSGQWKIQALTINLPLEKP